MSQENVELIRALVPSFDTDIAALFRSDELWTVLVDSFATVIHPDYQCVLAWPGGHVGYAGVDGLRKGWLEWIAPWESYYTEIEELIDAGDKVVALVHDRARRSGVDAEFDLLGATVYSLRDGMILRSEHYPGRAEALEAVGLSD